jgi:hypothetical protein
MAYLIQVDDDVRPATAEEAAAIEALAERNASEDAALVAKAEAKAYVLERLGITAEEAALLLG